MPTYLCRNCKKPLDVGPEAKGIAFSLNDDEGKKKETKSLVIRCPHCNTMNTFEVPKK